jgi:hypothetical protein
MITKDKTAKLATTNGTVHVARTADIDMLLSIWKVKVLRTPFIRFPGRH